MGLNIFAKEQKGNSDCHIPSDKYRDNYDNIFRKRCDDDDTCELDSVVDGDGDHE